MTRITYNQVFSRKLERRCRGSRFVSACLLLRCVSLFIQTPYIRNESYFSCIGIQQPTFWVFLLASIVMHGVRRGSRPSAEQLEQELEQSKLQADLIRRALIIRGQTLPTPLDDVFETNYSIVTHALETHPDEYTLWAFRREVLLARSNEKDVDMTSYFQQELSLTARALKRHPKAYPAWQHRLWLLEHAHHKLGVDKQVVEKAVMKEHQLSAYMLSRDGRNFHGWAHRMRVRAVMEKQRPEHSSLLKQNELQFVEDKINDDFANFSAWHHRSVLLPQLKGENPHEFIENELQYVRGAFYTEPDVQSAWFYHRWLLAGAPARGKKAIVNKTILEDELEACNELLEMEPDARYALQTKVLILTRLGRGSEALETLDTLEKLVSFSHILRYGE